MQLDRITLFCFGASYAVAWVLELFQQLRPRTAQRVAATAFGLAGLVAHTLFLVVQRPSLATQFGSFVFLAWILAVFYLYGSLHHRRLAWGVFVLPVVLGLVVLAAFFRNTAFDTVAGARVWGAVHGVLLLLAGVGVCVAFVASLMYLVQARRLRAKVLPGQGLRLLSLERLEQMNRHAIILAFPLLTAGLLVGAALMFQDGERLSGWTDPKVVSVLVLWAVFVILLYLRYSVHVSGRRTALLTIMAFALLLFVLVTPPHTFTAGGGP